MEGRHIEDQVNDAKVFHGVVEPLLCNVVFYSVKMTSLGILSTGGRFFKM
jgi:hypothetical protein